MDNGFNKARPKKENPSLRKIQTSGDPFGAKPLPRVTSVSDTLAAKSVPITEPAPATKPAPEPKSVPSPGKTASSSNKITKSLDENSPLLTKKREVSKKPFYLAIVFAPVLVVIITTAILIFSGDKRTEEPKKESEEKDAPVVVEKNYPKETATTIDVTIAETEIQITESSHYILSGETKYPIIVNAPGEVVIYLNGVSVSPVGATALANLSEHPLTLILEDNTTTNLQTNSPDANAIYSEGDLTIKGNGILNVAGINVKAGHELKEQSTINNLKM